MKARVDEHKVFVFGGVALAFTSFFSTGIFWDDSVMLVRVGTFVAMLAIAVALIMQGSSLKKERRIIELEMSILKDKIGSEEKKERRIIALEMKILKSKLGSVGVKDRVGFGRMAFKE